MKLTKYIRDAYVASVMNDVPSTDYNELAAPIITACVLKTLPAKVVDVWHNLGSRPYLQTATYRCHGFRAELPSDDRWVTDLRDISETDNAALSELRAKADAQHEQHAVLRDKIRGVANSVSTRQALAKALPEFEKYLPAVSPKTGFPVALTDVMADFTKAVWPKGAEPK